MTTRGGIGTPRTIISSNASQAVEALIALGTVGQKLAGEVTVREAIRLKDLLRANAPYDTGEYRASIHYRSRAVKSGKSATVFSTADYARRLEFGFSGMTDRIGRYYQHWETEPKPHWQPMVDKVEKGLEAKYAAAMKQAARIVATRFPG